MKAQRTRIISIVNQKGGVGKTTTTINLGTALAAVGQRVLLIDLDPQGNASTSIGIPGDNRELNTYTVLMGETEIGESTLATQIPGMDIVPSSDDLTGAEIELVNVGRREFRLREMLLRSIEDYDYVLIDCPPTLGLLTVNALVASQAVLVPMQCEFLALEGISKLIHTIDSVKRSFNPGLDIQGIVLTMHDQRNNLSQEVANDVRDYFGDKVYKTVIPRNVRISEAPSHGLPVLVYDVNCTGSKAYLSLAGEIIHREKRVSAQ